MRCHGALNTEDILMTVKGERQVSTDSGGLFRWFINLVVVHPFVFRVLTLLLMWSIPKDICDELQNDEDIEVKPKWWWVFTAWLVFLKPENVAAW